MQPRTKQIVLKIKKRAAHLSKCLRRFARDKISTLNRLSDNASPGTGQRYEKLVQDLSPWDRCGIAMAVSISSSF
jgi:hypothetical protein